MNTFVSRQERQTLERKEWIVDAMGYMLNLSMFKQETIDDCCVADSLYYSCRDEGGGIMYSPEEAVDEEFSYWGE